MTDRVYWITWEDHRRSRELAKAFGAQYVPLLHKGERYIRYPILAFRTMVFLIKQRPTLLFCQNPSIVLSAMLVFLKPLFRYVLVMDRHSNFKFPTQNSRDFKWRLFHTLSRYVNAHADLTIVTNEHLKSLVDEVGGRGVVLQDKLPELNASEIKVLRGKFNVVFVSTFSDDEPIGEVFEAASSVGDDVFIYITGNYKKYDPLISGDISVPNNVELTGFLCESDYQVLLKSADAIMVITDMEYTLTCGAYEGVSVGRPLILSDTKTIREYFKKGALYSTTAAADISEKILLARQSVSRLAKEVSELKPELQCDWEYRFAEISKRIRSQV